MRRALLLPLMLAACVAAPSPGAPAEWRLASIDGQPFAARATIAFAPDGAQAFGQAPCNRWSGQVTRGAGDAWRVGKVVATEMACDQLAAEGQFFAALQAMTRQRISGDVLELSDGAGRVMLFRPAEG
ncbi:MAG: META domain-containing protein [Rhodobacteraceae bacterium]|nr:META domain-containing protein [Paracoccaceae bacterium]